MQSPSPVQECFLKIMKLCPPTPLCFWLFSHFIYCFLTVTHLCLVADPGGSADPRFRLGDHVILFANERGTSYTVQMTSHCFRRSLIQEQSTWTISNRFTPLCFEIVVESLISSFKTVWTAYVLTSFVVFHKMKHELCLFSFREKDDEKPIFVL